MDEHEVHRAKGQFKFGEFFSLINQVSPKYWLMSIGVLIGLVGTAINLVVPKIAANLINTFSKGIDYHLLLTVNLKLWAVRYSFCQARFLLWVVRY